MNGIIPSLKDRIFSFGSVLICFSGGLDSTVLLKNAMEALPNDYLAVFVKLPMNSERQIDTTKKISSLFHANILFSRLDWSDLPGVETNDGERCYCCKSAIYRKVREIAKERGFATIIAGENADDRAEDRPGRRAGTENGIIHPLLDLGIRRSEVVSCIESVGIPFPMIKDTCMATRYRIGIPIDEEKMRFAESCESGVRAIAEVKQLRVRIDGDSCVVQTSPEEIRKIDDKRDELVDFLKENGFSHIKFDKNGYTG